MVGRLRDDHLMVFGSRSGCGWRRLLSSQNGAPGLQLDFTWLLKPNADHFPFFDHGIPVLMVHTGLHDQYHKPSDAAKLVNTDGMMRVTRLLFGAVYEMAERPAGAPAYRAAARHESPETEKEVLAQVVKPADRLGVFWIDDAAQAGGVRVSSVTAGSPAEQAGVRMGDCIDQFAGRDIRTDDDFFGAVSAAESPAKVRIKRSDEPKPVELKVELPGSPLRWGFVWRVDDVEPGAIILVHVVPGSPAAVAGLHIGDRIYQVAGRDFADEAAFALLAKTLPAPLQLLVERDGRLRVVSLEVPQARPARRAA
jgi:membrane-associated protease RseP (regulator of RpoE activity)